MDGAALVPVFLVGLLGSVHCAGMCGGIVGALSLAPGVRVLRPAADAAPGRGALLSLLSYNAGRLGSYALAGALAGTVGGAIGGGIVDGGGLRLLAGLPALQAVAYCLANLLLAALGLYLMDAWRGLAWLERGGQLVWRPLWRHAQPLLRRAGPLDGPRRMLALGAVWGWLPCGMVYSVLATALLRGAALEGALTMLAFGAGTLPMLLALGVAGARLRAWLARAPVRRACGALVLGFGVIGLARAAGGLPQGWLHDLCVAGLAHAGASA